MGVAEGGVARGGEPILESSVSDTSLRLTPEAANIASLTSRDAEGGVVRRASAEDEGGEEEEGEDCKMISGTESGIWKETDGHLSMQLTIKLHHITNLKSTGEWGPRRNGGGRVV